MTSADQSERGNMPKIVVLGAGAMGSALCTPLIAAGLGVFYTEWVAGLP